MRVSVIVPTHARQDQLVRCVEALARLDFERDSYEVIVVDDGGPEPLDSSIGRYSDSLELTIATQRQRGPGAARNTGARLARGTLLAFTDDDCQPAPGWLRALVEKHARFPDRLLGGRTLNRLDDNLYATSSQLIVEIAYAHYNRDPDRACFFASNNMAMPARLFQRIGGFDEQFRLAGGEDRDLCDRWLHLGNRLVYVPEAVVFHGHDLDLAGFCRQHFNYGRGAQQFHRARTRRGSGSLRSEVKFHGRFLRLLRAPLSRLPLATIPRVLALLGLWQLLNLGGYLFGFVRGNSSTRPPRPV